LSRRQNVVWGGGIDVSMYQLRDSFGLNFSPDTSTDQNDDIFFQDEIRLSRAVLFTLGSKFEHNNFTGFEVEPNARLSWMLDRKNTLWASISRAVRKPRRFETDLRISAVNDTSPLTILSLQGNKDFDSEKVLAYEAGYRSKMTERFFFDLASFYNVYSDLESIEPRAPFTENDPAPSHKVDPNYTFGNGLRGESYGVEIAPQVQLTGWWRVQGQYSYLHERLHLQEGSADAFLARTAGDNPAHQALLRTSFNLPRHFELDGDVRYVDRLPNLHVGSYTVGDARIGWTGIRHMNFEVVGQNLFMSHHVEFSPGNEVERSVYGKVTWDF
jgi:iron complex outermembrane receptor protein